MGKVVKSWKSLSFVFLIFVRLSIGYFVPRKYLLLLDFLAGGMKPLLGDILVIAGTFCYAISNVGEVSIPYVAFSFVHRRSLIKSKKSLPLNEL